MWDYLKVVLFKLKIPSQIQTSMLTQILSLVLPCRSVASPRSSRSHSAATTPSPPAPPQHSPAPHALAGWSDCPAAARAPGAACSAQTCWAAGRAGTPPRRGWPPRWPQRRALWCTAWWWRRNPWSQRSRTSVPARGKHWPKHPLPPGCPPHVSSSRSGWRANRGQSCQLHLPRAALPPRSLQGNSSRTHQWALAPDWQTQRCHSRPHQRCLGCYRNPCDALVAPALNQSCSNGIRRYCTGDNVQMTGSMCAKIHRLKGWWKGTSGCLDTSMLSDTHPRSPSSPPGSRPILAADSLVTSKQLMGGSPPRPSQAQSWFQQEFHLQDDSNPVRHSCVQIFTKIHHLPLCCWFLFLFYNVATGLVMLLIKVIVFQRTLLPRALRVHGSTHGRQESSHKMLWMFSDCVQLKLFCEEDAGDSAVDCNRRGCLLCLLDLEKLPSIQTIKTSSGQWRNAFAITQGTHL